MSLTPANGILPAAALAQQDVGGRSSEILWILAALLGAVLLLVIIAGILRRLLLKSDDNDELPLTLGDFRKMHERGELSDAEFEGIRASILSKARADQDGSDTSTSGSAVPSTESGPAADEPAPGEPPQESSSEGAGDADAEDERENSDDPPHDDDHAPPPSRG